MSVTLDLTTGSYLLFRLLPFLVATVLSLAPLMVFSWKGLVYLCLLLATLAAASFLGPTAGAALERVLGGVLGSSSGSSEEEARGAQAAQINAVCSAFVLGAGAQPYSAAAPLDLALLSFSTLYLFYFIAQNGLGQMYRAVQVLFPAMTAAYLTFLLRNGCTSVARALTAVLVGGAGGWLGGMFVRDAYPSLMYFAAPTSRQSCTRVSDEVYTCRGGDPNQNAD